jgi:hypothetical protein
MSQKIDDQASDDGTGGEAELRRRLEAASALLRRQIATEASATIFSPRMGAMRALAELILEQLPEKPTGKTNQLNRPAKPTS